jgi:glycosyltransferase involved in cell wall biosynthesis
VVIPTRDRPALLAQAVASVRDQTQQVHEIIIVDDGSRPPVSVAALHSKQMRVLVHRNEVSKGPAAARNQGCRLASGDFIAFLDDDDYWLPEKVTATQTCIRQHPDTDIVIHRSSWTVPPKRSMVSCILVTEPTRLALLHQPPHLSGAVVRRSLHLEVGFDETFPAAADLDYVLRIFERGRVRALPDVFAVHSRPEEEISAITMDRRIAGRLAFHAKHARYFQNRAIEAFFLARLAHQYRRAGRRWRAIAVAAKSILARPTAFGFRTMLTSVLPAAITRARMAR